MTTTTGATVYPVQIDADLDPGLSRGLWIVKWLLAIPPYVILAFLWAAFVVLSVVAFFSILFTGRYPSPSFDFTSASCGGNGGSPTAPSAPIASVHAR